MNNWLTALLTLAERYQHYITWVSAIGFLLAFISIIAIPWWLLRIPANYFSEPRHHPAPTTLWHWLRLLVRNSISILMICAGIIMLVIPGQGLLTILIGVSLSTFPGKYRLERRVIQNDKIFHGINWIRRRYQRPPLIYPDDE